MRVGLLDAARSVLSPVEREHLEMARGKVALSKRDVVCMLMSLPHTRGEVNSMMMSATDKRRAFSL